MNSNNERPDSGERKGVITGQQISPKIWLCSYPLPMKAKKLRMEMKRK